MAVTCQELEVKDDDELVSFCEGEYAYDGLKAAFTLGGATFMRARHLRSYTEAQLLDDLEKQGVNRLLVRPWLDDNNLRRFLRDYQSPAAVKKAKTAEDGALVLLVI